MTKEIKLTTGGVTLVDEEDYEFLTQNRWRRTQYGYAVRNITKPYVTTEFLHRMLLLPKEGYQVDHINGDKLDNRRSNLRIVTPQQNIMNRPVESGTESGYKGVTRENKDGNTWRARIYVKGKRIHLGTFGTKEEAAQCYNEAAIMHFGEFAWLNEII